MTKVFCKLPNFCKHLSYNPQLLEIPPTFDTTNSLIRSCGIVREKRTSNMNFYRYPKCTVMKMSFRRVTYSHLYGFIWVAVLFYNTSASVNIRWGISHWALEQKYAVTFDNRNCFHVGLITRSQPDSNCIIWFQTVCLHHQHMCFPFPRVVTAVWQVQTPHSLFYSYCCASGMPILNTFQHERC